jgi:elongation factor G
MDRIGADFYRGLSMIRERLGANPVALQLPLGSEENFRGFVDLIEKKAVVYTDDLGTTTEETKYRRYAGITWPNTGRSLSKRW